VARPVRIRLGLVIGAAQAPRAGVQSPGYRYRRPRHLRGGCGLNSHHYSGHPARTALSTQHAIAIRIPSGVRDVPGKAGATPASIAPAFSGTENDMQNLILELVGLTRSSPTMAQAVEYLRSQIESSRCETPDVQYLLTALQTALRAHTRDEGVDPGALLCSFCGRSEEDSNCVVTSSEAQICDGCVDNAAAVVAEERSKARRMRLRGQLSWLVFKAKDIATQGRRMVRRRRHV
jgi:hypothetical protein